jgi:ribosomal protein S18 acetylase RimI-like enzyme
MDNYNIRTASESDKSLLIEGLVAMVQAMAAHGGHPVNNSDSLRRTYQVRLDETFARDKMLYLVADVGWKNVGVLEASHFQLSGVFEQRDMLHIHAVHVDVAYRRRGIARQLIEQAMVWGRERGCTIVELNVLVNNPGRNLYHSMGFTVFQYEMTREL